MYLYSAPTLQDMDNRKQRIILAVVILTVISSTLSVPDSTLPPPIIPDKSCPLPDRKYLPGESWFRLVEKGHSTSCLECQCIQGDRVNCSNRDCSSDICDHSSTFDSTECCRLCRAPSRLLSPPDGRQVSCLHNGRVYQDGQAFASNFTGLQTDKPNQCVQCVCQGGLVLCRLKTCSSMQCSSPVPSSADCCPVCQARPSEPVRQAASPVLITVMMADDASPTDENGDCIAGQVVYKHGSTWHPVIGPFGQMDCVVCKCLNGRIECSRVRCPAIHSLPCSKPQQLQGQCCPSCTNDDVNPRDDKTDMLQVSSSGAEDGSLENMCLPQQANTVVHKSHASGSSSRYYQYAFQSTDSRHDTRLLSWTLKDGQLGDFSEQHLSKEEFNTVTRNFKFKLLGATRTRFMEKFINKVKRFPEKCGNRCPSKIERLERVLHLQEIMRKHHCQSSEVPFQK